MESLLWLMVAVAGTGVAAAVAYNVLKIGWFIVSWRVLGLKQVLLDEKQVKLTAEECTADYLRHWKKGEVRPEALASYTAWAIMRYIQNWSHGARPFWKKAAELPEYESKLKVDGVN